MRLFAPGVSLPGSPGLRHRSVSLVSLLRNAGGLLTFFNADDASSYWQDTGMTTPAAADAAPVAKLNDRCLNQTFYDLSVLGGLDANRARLRLGANGVNGYPAIDFIGAGGGGFSCLENTSFGQSLTAFTIYLSGVFYETNLNAVVLSVEKAGTNPWQGTSGFIVKTNGVSTDLLIDGGEDQGNPMQADITVSNTLPSLICIEVNTSGTTTRTLKAWVNGGNSVSDTGTGPAALGGLMTLDNISFGDFAAGGLTGKWKMRHGAIFSGVHSLATKTTIGNALSLASAYTISTFQ